MGKPEQMQLSSGDMTPIPLAGTWRFHIEHDLDPVDMETFGRLWHHPQACSFSLRFCSASDWNSMLYEIVTLFYL